MATATQIHQVHLEAAGFQAFGEFHGSNVDCSADAELMARHPLDGSPLDAATLDAWWQDYTASGHGDAGGATLDDIHWHLTEGPHKLDPSHAKVARYIPLDTVSQSALRTALIEALVAGQTCIVFLGTASAGLAYNERGVNGHFVALGGIDSDAGYLVGNGDDVAALGGNKGVIPCRWYGWQSLANASVNGMIALAAVNPPALPYTQVTLMAPMTWAQIAATYAGGAQNAAWVLSWNAGLHSQAWWTVAQNTAVRIPKPHVSPPPPPPPPPPNPNAADVAIIQQSLQTALAAAARIAARS